MSDIELLQVDHINWPNSVISAAIATPPGSPSLGDRYIVAASPTGAWSGHANAVARWNGSSWLFQTPTAGRLAYNEATSGHLKFDGTNWVSFTTSGTLQNAYDAGATIALSATDLVASDTGVEVLRLGSTTKFAAPAQPTANTVGYSMTITGSTGGAAAVSGTPGDGGTVTIAAGAMGSETSSPGSVAGGVAGNNLILQGGSGGNTSGLKAGNVVVDGGQVGSGAAGGTPVPGDVKIGTNANQTHVVRVGQSTNGTPVEVKGPIWTPITTLTDSTTITVTLAKGNTFKVVIGGNRTLDFSFPASYSNSAVDVSGLSGRLVVQQDATGSRTLAFATKVKTTGDVTLNSAANAYTVFSFEVETTSIIHLRKVEASTGSSAVTSFNSRTGAVTPQTGDYTATNVGLGNVTNDAQLKRSAGDIASFTVKATPVANDLILIEDSAASNAKKSATLTSLASAIGAGVTSFNGRSGAVAPGSSDYNATQVGLGNVTNDSQLKRSASDFSSFTHKTTPTSSDVIVIEDAAASGAKKYCTLSEALAAAGAGVSSFNGRTGAVTPGSSDYNATQVGLGSVTNDAQLKRSSGDFSTFTHKTTPATTDVLLLEDSAASGAKKYATVSELIAAVSSGVVSFNSRTGSVTPQTGDYTASNVGLGSVTNDAQLKRAASDFSSFTTKSTPVSADVVLIEDSAASGAKKSATLSSLATAIGAASFDPTTSINPRNYWRASGTSQSGGSVDSITDIGRVGGKNFTQTGSARCVTATDGSGRTYLAPNGSSQYYQAGANTDWNFLHNGSAFTIAFVYQRAAAITASEWILDTSNGTTLNTGISIDLEFTSSTVQGPLARISRSATSNFTCVTNHYVLNTSISLVVIRHQGPGQVVTVGSSSVPIDMTMRRNGRLVSQCSGQGSYDTNGSFGALTLFAKAGAAGFSAVRLYEIWVDDTSVSDRLIQGYEGWANTNYGSLS